jgi:hypothetical protein
MQTRVCELAVETKSGVQHLVACYVHFDEQSRKFQLGDPLSGQVETDIDPYRCVYREATVDEVAHLYAMAKAKYENDLDSIVHAWMHGQLRSTAPSDLELVAR